MSLIDFKNLNDNGFITSDAIQPINDGEFADQALFRRPSENLRSRSEVLRSMVNSHDAVMAQDRSMLMMAATATPLTMAWNGTAASGGDGKFTPVMAGNGIILAPALSSVKYSGGTPVANSSTARIVYPVAATPDFEIKAWDPMALPNPADRTMAGGAENIFFRMFRTAVAGAHAPIVTFTGSLDPTLGPCEITVELDNDGAGGTNNTYDDVIAAIAANASAAGVIKGVRNPLAPNVVIPALLWGATGTRNRLFAFLTYGVGGVDSTSFLLPPATWAGPWAGGAVLEEGDILALDFANATARRTADLTIAAADLVVIKSYTHSNAGNNQVFPLVKIYQNAAYLFNGIKCTKGEVVVVEHEYAPLSHSVATNAAAHAIYSIDKSTRPFVVVHPTAYKGDYQTLKAAILGVQVTGGTIFIKNGAYTETDIDIASTAKSMHILGESRDGVVITLATHINIATHIRHTFEDITFQCGNVSLTTGGFFKTNQVRGGTAYALSTGDAKNGVSFRNCYFMRATAAISSPYKLNFIESSISLDFDQCYFQGLADTTLGAEQNRDRVLALQVATSNSYFAFNRCSFNAIRQVIWGYRERVPAFDEVTDKILYAAHGLFNGEPVTFKNVGGALPTGILADKAYYVVNKTIDDFQIEEAVGSGAFNFTSNGVGTNYVISPIQQSIQAITVTNCLFSHSGYCQQAAGPHNDADWTYLIDVPGGGTYPTWNVTHNEWADTGAYSSQSGGFCRVTGIGEIGYNRIIRVPRLANGMSYPDAYIIRNDTYDNMDAHRTRVYIHHNLIDLNTTAVGSRTVGGISGQLITENVIHEFVPTVATQYAIRATAFPFTDIMAAVVRNSINCSHPDSVTLPPAGSCAIKIVGISASVQRGRVRVTENFIRSIRDNQTGIHITYYGNDHTILNNFISSFNSATPVGSIGIYCDAGNCVISGNDISQVYTGIYLAAHGNVVSGNNIYGNSGTLPSGAPGSYPTGIYLGTSGTRWSSSSVVTGNLIRDFHTCVMVWCSGDAGKYSLIANNNLVADRHAGIMASGVFAYWDGVGAYSLSSSIVGNRIALESPAVVLADTFGIQMLGNPNNIENVAVGGNMIHGFDHMVAGINVDKVGMEQPPTSPYATAEIHAKNWGDRAAV